MDHTRRQQRNSDHLPIAITCNARLEWTPRYSTKTPHTGRNWDLFAESMETAAESMQWGLNNKDPVELYQMFTKAWESAIAASGRTRRKKPQRDGDPQRTQPENSLRSNASAPWWDDECREAVEARKEALKNYTKKGSRENFLLHKKQNSVTKKFLKEKKKSSFVEFCGTLSRESTAAYVWSKIKAFKNRVTAHPNKSTTNAIPTKELEDKIAEPHLGTPRSPALGRGPRQQN